MDRLADVELQLVMHGLAVNELLQLARCSRRHLQLADSAFAWKHTALRLDVSNLTQTASARSFDLLRHASATLILRVESSRVEESSAAWLLRAAASLRVRELDLSEARLSFPQLLMVLAFSNLAQHLRVLRICCPLPRHGALMDVECMRAIVELPHLHSLTVLDMRAAPSTWSLLRAAPSLTSVELCDHYRDEDQRCIPAIAECESLVRLSIHTPLVYTESFRLFCHTPSMQRLQRLELDGFRPFAADQTIVDAPTELYDFSFRALSCLHTLHLRRVLGLDAILPSVSHAPSLAELVLRPAVFRAGGSLLSESVPTLSVLCALLISAPNLHVTLEPMKFAACRPTFEEGAEATIQQQYEQIVRDTKLGPERISLDLGSNLT